MGFSAGVPLLMTISILQAWMKDSGIDLSVIGFVWVSWYTIFSKVFMGTIFG